MSAASIRKRIRRMNDALNGELAKNVSAKGYEEAQTTFGNDVSVHKDEVEFWIKGVHAMVAEFGAGTGVDESHQFAGDMGFPVKKGSYSDKVEGEYKKSGYKHWHHNHTKYEEVVPVRGMYLGMKCMREHLQESCDETTGWNK